MPHGQTLTTEDYHAMYLAAPDGCIVVDRQGRVTDANPKAETLFGWSREELVGKEIEVLVPDAMRAAHAKHRARYTEHPHDRPMGVGLALRGRRKDGSTFPVEVSLSGFTKGSDGEVRVICAVRDVSDYKRLRDFSEGALRATEDERARIARELHDDTAQRLATLILRVRVLADEPDPVRRSVLLEQVRGEIVQAAEGVKRISRGLRPPELEEVGLGLALQAHLRSLREGAGFRVDADLGVVDPHLTITQKLALYRVVQEALSNARRHSGADHASVVLRTEGREVVAEVSDSGRGFRYVDPRDSQEGLGLIGMRERVAMLGGRLDIDSVPGRGTRVRATVPMASKERLNG